MGSLTSADSALPQLGRFFGSCSTAPLRTDRDRGHRFTTTNRQERDAGPLNTDTAERTLIAHLFGHYGPRAKAQVPWRLPGVYEDADHTM